MTDPARSNPGKSVESKGETADEVVYAQTDATGLPMRILGLDPGLQITGYGLIDLTIAGPRLVEAGVIRPAERRSTTDLAVRIRVLYDELEEILDLHRPDCVAVEQLFAHYDHPRTAVLMAHARGVLLLAAARRDLTVHSYTPGRVKKLVTGHGRAGKEQVQHSIARELKLPSPPEPADVADALAVALCHAHARSARGRRLVEVGP